MGPTLRLFTSNYVKPYVHLQGVDDPTFVYITINDSFFHYCEIINLNQILQKYYYRL